ncbi:efflux RND transporter periplasmic adaptor subunit [Vagococcus silagei]|nr:HlyD family efflux transporter periplasmic adaptor subunit [Vagococcus silagei]
MTRSDKQKMSKKKKVFIILGVVVVVLAILYFVLFGGSKKPKEVAQEDLGIDYYTVEDVEQVFINGVVTPVKSKEFIKDATLGKLGDLQVKNGDVVDEGTVLYQYVDDQTSTQITELKFQIESTQAEKDKAARQMQLDLNELGNASAPTGDAKAGAEEGEMAVAPQMSRESIELKYDLPSFDAKINQLQSQITELNEKQINQVKAPFKGQVTIPQEQNRDSAILTLKSNDFYVEGEVNEKDLSKIKVKQPADVRTIANDKLYKGEISYVSNSPSSKAQPAEGGGGMMGGGGGTSSLSNYTVKLTLKDADNITDGFHVQASIKLEDKKIELPLAALKKDKEQQYVLVDDFGTVVRKDIQTTDKGAKKDHVVVISGLDALDKVILKSKNELKNGDIIDPNQAEEGTEVKE